MAGEAFALWQQDRLPEADQRYQQALATADPGHYRTPDLHGQYAGLLTRMNRLSDAGRHYETALYLELKNDPNEASAPVLVARYFLGEHYLQVGEPESARRVVAPSLQAADKPLAWVVEAEALGQSGAFAEARAAAERAVALAASPEQRERLRARLAGLLGRSES